MVEIIKLDMIMLMEKKTAVVPLCRCVGRMVSLLCYAVCWVNRVWGSPRATSWDCSRAYARINRARSSADDVAMYCFA